MATKKKKKGLLEQLKRYQSENEFGRKQLADETGKKAAKAKVNTKKAFAGKQLAKTSPTFPLRTAPPPVSAPPPVKNPSKSASTKTESKEESKPKPARQQASTTRSNRNRGMTGYGYTGGRGGSSKPTTQTSNKPKRSSYGPGRSGAAAYNRALQAWRRKNKTSTNKESLKVNRRGRRV